MSKFRILIIDDDKRHLKTIKAVIDQIKSPKIEIVTQSDGLEAFKILQNEYNYNFILIDITLRQIDGLVLLRYLKENKNFIRSYIAILSTSNNPKDIEVARKNGADAYITKPINCSEESMKRLQNIVKLVKTKGYSKEFELYEL